MHPELLVILVNPAFWWAFIGLSAIPFAMYLVAYVFESRKPGKGPNNISVWKDQSRAFLPGELGLALVVAICLQFRDEVTWVWARSFWWALVSFGIGALIYWVTTRYVYTRKEYEKAWKSPTKRYHDVVMYWLFGAAMAYVCLPVYFTVDWSVHWPLQVVGWGTWLIGMYYDLFTAAGKRNTPSPRQHPSEWTSIWRRS